MKRGLVYIALKRGLIYLAAVLSAITALLVARSSLTRSSGGLQPQGPDSAKQVAESKTSGESRLYVPPPKQEKPFTLDMATGVTMEFMWIPPGEFMMGDPREGILRHRETFTRPFYLGATEVTQRQWDVVMATNPSVMKAPDLPVHRAQWEDCQVFLAAMNEKYNGRVGMKFSLPTEAQWEYACRAGNVVKVDTPDDPLRIAQYAWLGSNSHYEPHPVAQKKPNDWGLYDMQGNVAEWCADVLPASAGPPGPASPGGASDSPGDSWYVVRGGNYRDGPPACTSTSRFVRRAAVPLRYDGLRLVCEPLR